MLKKLILTIMLVLFSILSLNAAKPVVVTVPVTVNQVENAPLIDGKLDESAWKNATEFTGFKTTAPDYGMVPSEKTSIYMTYDRRNIYFAVKGFDASPGKLKASVTRRDNLGTDDWVAIELDTMNDRQANYLFKINPLGIQEDGMVKQDEKDDLSMDIIWYSKGRVTKDGFVVEMAIPFKSLRLPHKKEVVMGIGFRRSISRKSEMVTFPEYHPGRGSRLTQRKEIMISGITYKRTMEFTPVATMSGTSGHSGGLWNKDSTIGDAGITAKVGITPGLTLDATYNPDFSHIEGDAGQIDINLRNALFLAEKRPFFMEGKENFDLAATNAGFSSGIHSIANTRKIIDPLLGLKINGKLGNKNLISGIFALDEYEGNSNHLILRYKRALNNDGYVGGFFTGRGQGDEYNRVLGTDGRIRLNGKSKIEFHAFSSFSNDINNETETGHYSQGSALALEYSYWTRRFRFNVGAQDISENFRVDSGYQRRAGITRVPLDMRYVLFPKSKLFQRVELLYVSQHTLDKASHKWETFNWTGFEVYLPRQVWFYFGHNQRSEVYLSERYNYSYWGGGIFGQIFKRLYLETWLNVGYKPYYDPAAPFQGKSEWGAISLVWQPTEKLRMAVDFSFENFRRELDNKKIYNIRILRSRNTFQFNKYLYLRGIVEYNSYYKRIQGDILASFTYIPGTVMQAGYGSVYRKQQWEEENQRYTPADNYMHTQKSFFMKASYLWRL